MGSQVDFITNYEKDTWVHRLDPRAKLFLVLTFVFVPLFFTEFIYLVVIFLMILPLWISSKIEVRPISGLIVAIIIFSLVAVVFATFYNYDIPGQKILFSLGPLRATDAGFYAGLILGFRSAIPAFSVLILICTTDPALLAKAMMKMKIPLTLSFMILGALRMFPLVTSEMHNITVAQRIRGVNKKGFANSIKAMNMATLPLLINSLRKSRTMGLAIESKGFANRAWKEYYQEFTLRPIDWAVFVVSIAILIAAFVLRFYFGLGVSIYKI